MNNKNAVDLTLKQVNDIKPIWEELIRKMIPPSVVELQYSCGIKQTRLNWSHGDRDRDKEKKEKEDNSNNGDRDNSIK